jgi:hypothetical protein
VVRVLKAETAAIAAVLGEEWESEEDLIKALWDRFFELLEERDLYGVRWGGLAFGPFTAKVSAQKLCRELDDVAFVAPLLSAGRLKRICAKANPITDGQHCPDCTHPKFAHGFTTKNGCVVKTCGCAEVYK